MVMIPVDHPVTLRPITCFSVPLLRPGRGGEPGPPCRRIIAYSMPASSGTALKIFWTTPAFVQSLQRVQTEFQCPKYIGRTRHGLPLRATHNRPRKVVLKQPLNQCGTGSIISPPAGWHASCRQPAGPHNSLSSTFLVSMWILHMLDFLCLSSGVFEGNEASRFSGP